MSLTPGARPGTGVNRRAYWESRCGNPAQADLCCGTRAARCYRLNGSPVAARRRQRSKGCVGERKGGRRSAGTARSLRAPGSLPAAGVERLEPLLPQPCRSAWREVVNPAPADRRPGSASTQCATRPCVWVRVEVGGAGIVCDLRGFAPFHPASCPHRHVCTPLHCTPLQ